MTDRRQRVAILLLLPLICSLVWAQQSQTPVFRTGVDLVQLDVSVLDKNRQPVRGLAQSDFTVLEDGKPQKLEAFAAIDLPDTVRSTTPWVNDVAPDVITNEIKGNRIFMIVLDDAAMLDDLWAIEAMRRSATSLIDRLGPDDLASVIFTRDNRGAQDLTNNRTKLKKAVSTLSSLGNIAAPAPLVGPRPPGGPLPPPCDFYLWSIQVVQRVTQYLSALPQRRKTLVYLAGGMAVDIGASRVVGPLARGYDPVQCGTSVVSEMREAFRSAQRSNVNIYGIDPMGLRVNGTLGSPGGVAMEFLQTVSENTGGKAITNTNDFEPGLTQIFRESSSYYLLGYRPPDAKADGRIHRLEVKVNRPDVEVRNRTSYHAPAPPKKPNVKELPPSPGLAAIADVVPKTDLPLRVALAPFASSGETNAVTTVVLGLERPAQSERAVEEIELLVRAFTPEGDPRGSFEQTMSLNIPPARRGETLSRYDLLAQLPLKPGRYQIRTSARSTTLEKLGSVYADIDVPDFANAPLSLTGVALTVVPGQPVAPTDGLKDVMPIVPTAARDFARYERVTAFLRIHQGGKSALSPVNMTTRVVDAQDKAVFDRTEVITAEAFAEARAADVRFILPLAQLTPGDYLLTFEAAIDKTTARRDIRFRVK